MRIPLARLARGAPLVALGFVLLACSSSSGGASPTASGGGGGDDDDDGGGGGCYPDNDGTTAGAYNFVLTVDDTGFSKNILTTQNSAMVTLQLTNTGKNPHGFEVECTSVLPSYPDLPKGCATMACFPAGSTIAPLAPGASATVTFVTPVPDGLIYPFKSSAPGDANVPGLNNLQWSLI